MPSFTYQARGEDGRLARGEASAKDEAELASRLWGQGLVPIRIRRAENKGAEKTPFFFLTSNDITLENLISFCRQMAAMLRSGLPLTSSLEVLASLSTHRKMRGIITSLRESVADGRPLSAAMSGHGGIFDELICGVVEAGEASGRLDVALEDLVEFLGFRMETRRRLGDALRYPAMVSAALGGAFVVLIVFVLPRFMTVFAANGVSLPAITRAFIHIHRLVVNMWPAGLIAILFALTALSFISDTDKGRVFLARCRLRLPVVGQISKNIVSARVTRILSLLMKSGLPLLQSYDLAAKAAGNRYIAEKLARLRFRLERGQSLSDILTEAGVLSPITAEMISAGERSGALEDMLEEAAGFYQADVERGISGLGRSLEPLLTAALACIVLLFALAVLTPWWDMIKAFRGA